MRLPKDIAAALDSTGLPWHVELGGKHLKLRMAGRMVGIMPRGSIRSGNIPGRASANTISQIKRVAREVQEHAV